ncbi:MAG TPA: GNAT family N-acetyltransferase [Gaiellaceae bacterium]|jgi:mycothiol synthase|nr:GNAT family N-acetyltransferase [Gaiellaceae bacterium]
MRVEEIDAKIASDELLLEVFAVEESCSPSRPLDPQVALAQYRHWAKGSRRRFVLRLGQAVVGTGILRVFDPAFATGEVFVRPEYRRRGYGRALFDAVVAAAREERLLSFFGHHHDGSGAGFAAAMGAVDNQRDIEAELVLADANLPEPVVPDGWRLRSWIGAAPDELVESFAIARDSMNDAPSPVGGFSEATTVDDIRAMEDAAEKRGRVIRVTVALDDHGVVGAFTDLRVNEGPTPVAFTDDTATIPSARGLGLATAVKIESLRLLRNDRPDVEVVTTTNAEENVGMRRVNTKVGFVPAVTYTTTVFTL